MFICNHILHMYCITPPQWWRPFSASVGDNITIDTSILQSGRKNLTPKKPPPKQKKKTWTWNRWKIWHPTGSVFSCGGLFPSLWSKAREVGVSTSGRKATTIQISFSKHHIYIFHQPIQKQTTRMAILVFGYSWHAWFCWCFLSHLKSLQICAFNKNAKKSCSCYPCFLGGFVAHYNGMSFKLHEV